MLLERGVNASVVHVQVPAGRGVSQGWYGQQEQVLPDVSAVQRVRQVSAPEQAVKVHGRRSAQDGGKPGPAHTSRTPGSGMAC